MNWVYWETFTTSIIYQPEILSSCTGDTTAKKIDKKKRSEHAVGDTIMKRADASFQRYLLVVIQLATDAVGTETFQIPKLNIGKGTKYLSE